MTRRGWGRGAWVVAVVVASGFSCACGGSAPPPDEPQPEVEPPADDASLPEGQEVPEDRAAPAPASEASETSAAPSAAGAANQAKTEPAFEAGMSVEQAISAVPRDWSRIELEQETLEQPLLQPELYEPCQLTAQQHFRVRVAIWNGRAVGLDVDSTPKNEAFESCLREQITGVSWKKVKALNTVQYAY